ncbi:hypothetical protein BH09ACT9_BH09ACT9_23990 [soil metagenome]
MGGFLTDLGQPLNNLHDDIVAQRVVGELLDVLHDLEVVARRARRQIDKAEQRRAAFHQRITHRDDAADREAAEREQRCAEESAARKALEDRISRVRLCAEQHGLILEKVPNYDAVGVERWRLVTSERGNRLLPHRFDDPTAWRALEVLSEVDGNSWCYLKARDHSDKSSNGSPTTEGCGGCSQLFR